MFKTFFAVLVAACAFVAIACLLHAPLISAAVVAHPLLFVILVAATIVVAFLRALRPEPRARAVRFLSFGILGAAAAALAGCVSPGAVTGAAPSTAGLSATDQLTLLKEANRHIETCDRTYAWPFAVTIHCAPVGGPSVDVATQIKVAVDQAVAAALAAAKAAPAQ